MKYTYHPMHMHLHAGNEPHSSFEGHIANAASLGMKYIRITGHDIRMGKREYPINKFDFTRGEMVYNDTSKTQCGWKELGSPYISFDENAMKITGSNGEEYGVEFFSSGKRHAVSLAADVTLRVGIRHINSAGKVSLRICLSQHPEINNDGTLEHKPASLVYTIGKAENGEISLGDNENGIYTLHISEDAQKYALGGLDNAFLTFQVICENGAQCIFNCFEIDFKHSFQPVLDRQRALAEEIGKRYGIKPFVTFEISDAGQHKNCYSTKVPIIDYQQRGYNVTQYEAIEHVKKHGGIFSYNHPFEKYVRVTLSDKEREKIVYRDAAALSATKVFGASLIEVGFTEGRSGFSLEEHLRLWDMLSLSGVFITGYGDSDSHNSERGWLSGNNFAAYIAADASLEFPVPEEEFIDSMKAGRVYTGDPVYLRSTIDFTSNEYPMGAVISIKDRDFEARKMKFTAESVKDNWKLRVIVDGEVFDEKLLKEGSLEYCFEVEPKLPVSFARVELYNENGRCIMLTNPIYLARIAELSDKIPQERIYDREENL